MSNYNFKNFFAEKNPIHNTEYVTNGYILIKKSVLKKSHLNYINSFEMQEVVINQLKSLLKRESEKPIITEFKPLLVSTINQIKPIELTYNAVITEIDRGYKGCNENISIINPAIKEEYYNFILDIKCKVNIVNNDSVNPLSIYNSNNDFVGIVLPVRLTESNIINSINYNDYIEKIEIEKENKNQRKAELNKKCLYIRDNKAIVRNKELICIADIIKNEEYRKLYVEADYKNHFGEVYIHFDAIFMCTGITLDKNDNTERIAYNLKRLTKITLNDYKEYIIKCLDNMQFINVAEIKLMELAGEPQEYINKLIEHKQKVIDLREKESQEREWKREQEDKEYIEQKNNEANEKIIKAEQAIINQTKVKNEDITTYKSKYDSNTTSIILYLMKQYNIKVPLKTQGWINKALASIIYDEGWTYNYYNSSTNSTVFMKYFNELIEKINNKYKLAS
jgi:hypothetical protein